MRARVEGEVQRFHHGERLGAGTERFGLAEVGEGVHVVPGADGASYRVRRPTDRCPAAEPGP